MRNLKLHVAKASGLSQFDLSDTTCFSTVEPQLPHYLALLPPDSAAPNISAGFRQDYRLLQGRSELIKPNFRPVRKRTVTTVETHQIILLRQTTLEWCAKCIEELASLYPEDVVLLAGVSLSDKNIHLIDTSTRMPVCTSSLPNNSLEQRSEL